jgi:Tol biopolymer transport system component
LREAQAAARLSHPHIAPIFEVFEEADRLWVAMEFIEGRTLRSSLWQDGNLPLIDVVRHAEGLAGALHAAHTRGVLHRDISPNNIMLTQDGRAILMDFGLAHCFLSSDDDGLTTQTTPDLGAGTSAYMSPEQILGKNIDVRSDLFSFGAVLYEMCTGRAAFAAGDRGAIFDAILNREPLAVTRLNYDVPPDLERIVRKSLAKRPDERYQTALDLLIDLRTLRRQIESGTEAPPIVRRRVSGTWLWLAGLATGLFVIGGIWWKSASERDVLPAGIPKQVTTSPEWEMDPALSPDGTLIAYSSAASGNPDIWMIDFQGGSALRLTDSPAADQHPKWFPDGSQIAFVSSRQGTPGIWSVPRLGGAARLLVDNAEDPAISPDGRRIAFVRTGSSGYFRLYVGPLSEPGEAKVVTGDADGLWDHRGPAWSPDGQFICYAGARDLWIVDTNGGKPRRLTTDDEVDFDPAWSSDGRHVYFSSYRQGTLALWRVALDGRAPLRLSGGSGPERYPSISRDGARLAYTTFVDDPDIIVRDLNRGVEHRIAGLRDEHAPILAPDGSAVAFTSDRLGGRFHLWVQPMSNGVPTGAPLRLTDHTGSVSQPSYSADGKWIAYHRVDGNQRDIWIVPSSGGVAHKFTDDPAADIHPAWSPDGTEIVFNSEREGGSHIWISPVKDGRPAGAARKLTSGPVLNEAPSWSPDGQWIAFISHPPSGRADVWIARADGQGAPRQLTTGASAGRVRWTRSSRELIVSGQWGGELLTLRRVPLEGGVASEFAPAVAFGVTLPNFDLSSDGRLLVFARENLRGDIWLLESRNGAY